MVRFLLPKKPVYGSWLQEVQLLPGTEDQVLETLSLKPADQG